MLKMFEKYYNIKFKIYTRMTQCFGNNVDKNIYVWYIYTPGWLGVFQDFVGRCLILFLDFFVVSLSFSIVFVINTNNIL